MVISNSFEEKYVNQGFSSQRKYPNESFLSFLGSNFFRLPIEKRKQTCFLELGCGSGANLWPVAREGFNAYGVDYSQTGLGLCQQMLESWGVKATLSLADMTSLPFEDGMFDVVFDVVSIQHLTFSQHIDVYQEAFRVLKDEGTFFSYHLGENSISAKTKGAMLDHCTVKNIDAGLPLAGNGQTCFLSANEVRHLLQKVGFVDIKVDKVLRTYGNQSMQVEYLVIEAKKSN